MLHRIRDYFIAQLRDGATWRGLVLIATALGMKMEPAYAEAIVIFGLLFAGLLGVIWPPQTK